MNKERLAEKMYDFLCQYAMLSTFIDDFMIEQEQEEITKEQIDKIFGYE